MVPLSFSLSLQSNRQGGSDSSQNAIPTAWSRGRPTLQLPTSQLICSDPRVAITLS